jgi:ligand-binding sensor domain-containing protein
VSFLRHFPVSCRVLVLGAGAVHVLLAAMPVPALSAPAPVPEGRPALRFFSTEHGLPQHTPLSFALDARGFLWTGTLDGAAVYNSRAWKTVDMPNREESNTIRDIQAGADGSVWFATNRGLARLHEGRWTLFREQDGLPSDRIVCLEEEKDGARTVLWAGTDKGLARWDGAAWSVLDARAAGLPHQYVGALLALPTDQGPVLWVGTGRGLARRAGGRWTTFPAGSGPPEAAVTALLATRTGGRTVL